MVFTSLDIAVFLITLVAVMALGLWAGRKETSSEDYYLAGRSIRWWGVAGSIFGSNVSANHLVGMLGIGYSVGFAQSHFELGAIAGLMLLCYGFLPVYRRLRVYTLSEYLAQRYDERVRVLYALSMIAIMVVVHMVQGLYIGSRAMNHLLAGTPLEIGYVAGVALLATVAAVYTILGGLKAVIITDVVQSLLLLAAGITVAAFTFSQPEIGGWSNLMALDAAGSQKMHLYRPTSDSDLPWTGVLTGLMCLHFFYWGTNQFIVQRTLGARSDGEARLGIVTAGYFKLLIPFFSIGTGIAAFYYFPTQNLKPDADAAFTELVRLVVPLGWGVVGVIAAGLIGAILSSIDSMMNSAATIVTMDLYRRYGNPAASERQLIRVGRWSIVGFVILAALLAAFVVDPNSEKNFFFVLVDQQSHLVPGLLVAFALGMFWRRATAAGALAAVVAGPIVSGLLPWLYLRWLAPHEAIAAQWGSELNMLHRVALVVLFCTLIEVVVSWLTAPDAEKSRLVWTDLGGHAPHDLDMLLTRIALSVVFFALLAWGMIHQVPPWLTPTGAGVIAAAWTLAQFVRGGRVAIARRRACGEIGPEVSPLRAWISEDRLWSGLLCALAMWMMFHFY